jgi:acetyl-CoA carboxylase biotin carboxyl carrier protein
MSSNQNQPEGGQGSAEGASAQREESGAQERAQSQQQRHGRGRRRGGNRTEQGRPSQQQQSSRRGEHMLNLDEVRELTELFSEHGLTDFEFENADIRIRLSRNSAPVQAYAPAPPPPTGLPSYAAQAPPPPATTAPASQPEQQQQSSAPAPAAPEEELYIITSHIVGTFYRSPAPDAESFVKAGSHVEHDTVVCIIEAMKLMNEIQAETTGTVAKIYVENGQPVEYGQPLFGVRK